jgi:uncharacterized protein YutE (UPF0331/DUF86 family)
VTADGIKEKVIADKVRWIDEMLRGMRALPLESFERFADDARNRAAADSYLRRALEALMDLGRHILSKGLGRPVSEYKDVPRQLLAAGVLDQEAAQRMTDMAGYRNRLVHFYDEVTSEELYRICTERIGEIATLVNQLTAWVRSHPETVDRSL